ncbi:complement C4-B isoform X2 [Notolabrus celidotus]|uniref:complement C4-B isoform X2 n=1 Tax=Notolabrus celidotus TaxID=1203425 RepID=UPI00148F9B9A|nr:complement C4-B isoform X2 [Notolabrus celidotus]
MKSFIFSILFLVLTMRSECSPDSRFFISAPRVFHIGVNEKVFVQMGRSYFNNPATLYLEHETKGTVSERKQITCKEDEPIQTVELTIDKDIYLGIPHRPYKPRYLNLVVEHPSLTERRSTRVLVSKHRGYIFIQTHQPIYNPSQTVRYRIFTLDHTLRPHEETFQLSVFNPAGNRVINSNRTAKGGIYKGNIQIPDVSKLGSWKITAHYVGDEEKKASKEFKVGKFVLPSFEVNIAMEQRYILLNAERFDFSISAKYSHGEKVQGAYHCQFGVVEKDPVDGQKRKPFYIGGLEMTGSVLPGYDELTEASLQMADLHVQLQRLNLTLSELQQSGSQLYLGVFVTNIQSGEIQGDEVYLPVISQKYTLDLSRTRSYFLPGYPLDVSVVVRHPDGSPAADVPVKINVSSSMKEYWEGTTNQEGAVLPIFNIIAADQITVQVSADDSHQRKVIQRAKSPTNSYLYLSLTNRMYSVGESLTVHYNTVNSPSNGFIYYMVLSRGILVEQGKLPIGTALVHNLPVTQHMIPSFRLIGYFYDGLGNIIADSVWVDVKDECEIKVKVKHSGPSEPKQPTQLEFDLNGQKAKVAMLVVDKAIYALKADNKLTAKQVFSTMQSYDLGCSYTGGSDPDSVLTDAGLSFVTHSSSVTKKEFGCGSRSTRKRRAVDLQQEMITLRSNFSDENLKDCCVHGFSLIPMTRTCQERARRVSLVSKNPLCAEAFLRCCLEGERLRQKKREEDARKELGRTATTEDIEQYFLEDAGRNIRRLFPPSFEFTDFDVDGKKIHQLVLLDSITTWEIQVVTLSAATGFCVVKPIEVRAFKKIFVSLRLPYSVRKYEQLSISPVIYNYGEDTLQVAVNMEQTEGLCSPGSATTTAFVNITLKPQSSQFVSFSAVPMVTGSIPIKIHIYDIEGENGIDSIEKTLNVLTEGMEKRVEETKVFNLDGRRTDTFIIDGSLPEDTVPDSGSNIFVSVEGDGFGSSHAVNLLSPEKVEKLIVLPNGCLEQTMRTLYPTVLALRYLDLSDQWFDLPAGARDKALGHVETGYPRIISYKNKATGSYSSFSTVPSSYWATALIVKMLSMVAQRQSESFGQQGRQAKFVPEEEIRHPVRYLLSQQKDDGSFRDPNPVLHRDVLQGNDQDASTTAFITVALHRSLEFLNPDEKNNAEATISRSTAYLLSQLEDLKHPYAVAITAYCLAFCLPLGTDHSSAWTKLQALATEGQKGCLLWTTNPSSKNKAHADANTIETTAYALLTAVELEKTEWANKAACWLTTQENYIGGFRSTQDTVMALEALAEYEIKRPASTEANLKAVFTSPGKRDILKLNLENKKDRVERDLKKLAGQNINVEVSGIGKTKLKVVKAYHILEPKDDCKQVSIRITVQGKVKYTAKVIENYDYYDYDIIQNKDVRVPQSAIELFDAQTRNRRSLDNGLNSDQDLTYEVCVSRSMYSNLTGMAIADITLLSGFEAVTEDLDILKDRSEGYISHYEVSHGKVLVYFDRLFDTEECISFRAIQTVPIGLLQPAPAVFYDYYEPNRKCTVFYSAPRRSKLISKLCSEDVCQCAERPCHKVQNTFKSESGRRKKENKRLQHACFFPTVDYAYLAEVLNVSMKSNFELYRMNIIEVLKSYGDIVVAENSIRVFAKRLQCRGELELGTQYLIMGKDGSTTDSEKMMQYLLESNTWVERKPSEEECRKSANSAACREFRVFIEGYKVDGCRQ